VVVDELGKAVTDTDVETGTLRRIGGALQRLTGRTDKTVQEQEQTEKASVLSDPGRHHRRPAELAVRLAPYPAVTPGHPLAISVRMDSLHFFDERGDRIDVGWR
jgi:multiple sugar transport system ATP-binding protein